LLGLGAAPQFHSKKATLLKNRRECTPTGGHSRQFRNSRVPPVHSNSETAVAGCGFLPHLLHCQLCAGGRLSSARNLSDHARNEGATGPLASLVPTTGVLTRDGLHDQGSGSLLVDLVDLHNSGQHRTPVDRPQRFSLDSADATTLKERALESLAEAPVVSSSFLGAAPWTRPPERWRAC
jgi:hypothetical protein